MYLGNNQWDELQFICTKKTDWCGCSHKVLPSDDDNDEATVKYMSKVTDKENLFLVFADGSSS